MASYKFAKVPSAGERIEFSGNKLKVPNKPHPYVITHQYTIPKWAVKCTGKFCTITHDSNCISKFILVQ